MKTKTYTLIKRSFSEKVYVCFGIFFLPAYIITYPLQNPIKNIICCPE